MQGEDYSVIRSSYHVLNQDQARHSFIDVGHKRCRRCKELKPFSAFYVRSGISEPTVEGHYNSECKDCLRERSRLHNRISKAVPWHQTERIAIARLEQEGIAVLPGKAVHAADVDVVAWGHVWIEVKYSPVKSLVGRPGFQFNATLKQMKRGFLAHVVILICEYEDGNKTFHLFDAKDPVFYLNGRVKSALTYMITPLRQYKERPGRLVLTADRMNAALNRWDLIEQARLKISADLIANC